MSQQCYECGHRTPYGEQLQHYDDCDHLKTPKRPLSELLPTKQLTDVTHRAVVPT